MLNVSIGLDGIERARDLFAKFPARLKTHLKTAGIEASADLMKEISAGLQGARGGPNRITGALLRSWHVLPVKETADGIEAGAGSNKSYARYQDQGFHGVEQVVAKRMRTSAFGQSTRPYLVPPFSRNVNYPGKPYVNPAIDVVRDVIRGRFVAAVDRTWKETS